MESAGEARSKRILFSNRRSFLSAAFYTINNGHAGSKNKQCNRGNHYVYGVMNMLNQQQCSNAYHREQGAKILSAFFSSPRKDDKNAGRVTREEVRSLVMYCLP